MYYWIRINRLSNTQAKKEISPYTQNIHIFNSLCLPVSCGFHVNPFLNDISIIQLWRQIPILALSATCSFYQLCSLLFLSVSLLSHIPHSHPPILHHCYLLSSIINLHFPPSFPYLCHPSKAPYLQ